MALISCPECGQSVSGTAFSCPHCGYRRVQSIQSITLGRLLLYGLVFSIMTSPWIFFLGVMTFSGSMTDDQNYILSGILQFSFGFVFAYLIRRFLGYTN